MGKSEIPNVMAWNHLKCVIVIVVCLYLSTEYCFASNRFDSMHKCEKRVLNARLPIYLTRM